MQKFFMACAACVLAGQASATCIRDSQISFTDVKSDQVVLFHMNDRAVWRNDLPAPCANLKATTEGFSYQPTDPGTDVLCDGMVTLHVNGYKTAGCQIGNFTKVAGSRF